MAYAPQRSVSRSQWFWTITPHAQMHRDIFMSGYTIKRQPTPYAEDPSASTLPFALVPVRVGGSRTSPFYGRGGVHTQLAPIPSGLNRSKRSTSEAKR